jgi:hypothetical protein
MKTGCGDRPSAAFAVPAPGTNIPVSVLGLALEGVSLPSFYASDLSKEVTPSVGQTRFLLNLRFLL